MHSDLPKVLHPLAGRGFLRMCSRPRAPSIPASLCVVVGHGAEAIRDHIRDVDVAWALQEEQLGTGHAVLQAVPQLEDGGSVLVLYGDVPSFPPPRCAPSSTRAGNDKLALLTQELDRPKGYGRIVRDPSGDVVRIVEEKDASDSERAIREVNTGIMAMPAREARRLARAPTQRQRTGRVLSHRPGGQPAVADGTAIAVRHPAAAHECLGVNSKAELAAVERILQMNEARRLLRRACHSRIPRGPTCAARSNAAATWHRRELHFRGAGRARRRRAYRRELHPQGCDRRAGSEIKPFSLIEEAQIGAEARIGPYAASAPEPRWKTRCMSAISWR
jgi:bifunctional UDP-N-acetylglucosamine pyrophosphorylase/glucosamine-1-phosphate N-acetyltransferase